MLQQVALTYGGAKLGWKSGKILEELVDVGNRICYYGLHGVKF